MQSKDQGIKLTYFDNRRAGMIRTDFQCYNWVPDTLKTLNMQLQAQGLNLRLLTKSTCGRSVLVPEVFSNSKTSSLDLNTLI